MIADSFMVDRPSVKPAAVRVPTSVTVTKRPHTKVRSGCSTCKIRRVKCDESRPSCQRCTSSGRQCAGYAIFRAVKPTYSPPPKAPEVQRQLSLFPGATEVERDCIDYFQANILRQLLGDFIDVDFNALMVQTAVSDHLVRHAVLAISSTQRGLLNQEQDSKNIHFALYHYGAAMKSLQTEIGRQSKAINGGALLLTSMLLVCFEYLNQRYENASLHLKGGFLLLEKLSLPEDRSINETHATTADPSPEVKVLTEIFERLDLLHCLFTSSNMVLASRPEQETSLNSHPQPFRTVLEARAALMTWTTQAMGLTGEIDALLGKSLVIPDGLLATLRYRQAKLRHLSQQWFQAVSPLVQDGPLEVGHQPLDITRVSLSKPLTILHIRALASSIMIETALSRGRECDFDNHLPDFERIVNLADRHVRKNNHVGSQEPQICSPNTFSLELGIIAPLFYVSSKCRDPMLRRRAISILEHSGHREGPWDARQMAMCASKIVKLEEQAAVVLRNGKPLCCASDIPEAARPYQAYFDLTKSDRTVYCKRRVFGDHDKWISYNTVIS